MLKMLILSGWIISLIPLLVGCVSIRTEYPEIVYYQLEDQPLDPHLLSQQLDLGLWIRSFSVDAVFDTDRFVVVTSGGQIQRLFGHRWGAEIAELITDAVSRRIVRYGIFRNGVFRHRSLTLPALLLEARIVNAAIVNDDSQYAVTLSIYFTVSQRTQHLPTHYRPVVQKLITVTVDRPEATLETVAPAMSKAVAKITDQLLSSMIAQLTP